MKCVNFVVLVSMVALFSACSSDDETTEPTADTGNTSGTDTGASDVGNGADTTVEPDVSTGPTRAELIQEYSNTCLATCTQTAACDSTMYPLAECEDECTDITGVLVSELPETAEASACVAAEIALEACIGGLTCDEVDQYYTESIENYPCLTEETASTTACASFE